MKKWRGNFVTLISFYQGSPTSTMKRVSAIMWSYLVELRAIWFLISLSVSKCVSFALARCHHQVKYYAQFGTSNTSLFFSFHLSRLSRRVIWTTFVWKILFKCKPVEVYMFARFVCFSVNVRACDMFHYVIVLLWAPLSPYFRHFTTLT